MTGVAGANSITLNWDDSTDNVAVVGYDIYQDDVLISTRVTSGMAVLGLTGGGTSYDFYVVAKDAAGNESTPSATLTISTTA